MFDPSLYTLLLFLAMFLHECGHLLALFLCGKQKIQMTLSAFGAEIHYDGYLDGVGQEISVALGGIVFNLLSALVAFWPGREREEVMFFAVASLVLACLNLLPIGILDGGRALQAILSLFMQPDTIYAVMRRISTICIILLFLLSLLVLVGSSFNFSLLLFTLYLSLSVFR